MRSRGWAGATPASDEEAISRILDAVDDVVAERGSALSLADVARRLGVTRQTVYRYFPNADALLMASAMRSVGGLFDQIAEHVGGLDDPVTAVVECICFATERLTGDPQLEPLLFSPAGVDDALSSTSDTATSFCLSMFHRLRVDWRLHGFDDAGLRELAEMTLRTTQSLLLDPGQHQRDAQALRRFVTRWLGPAVLFARTSSLAV